METFLTPAEAILQRTGPNNITVLFEADGGFDPARALRGVEMVCAGAARFRARLRGGFRPAFLAPKDVDFSRHVSVLRDATLSAPALMDVARRLALPPGRPLWRAVLVNPDGHGWSGLVLHFDHAIADGTRISQHIVRRVQPGAGDTSPIGGLAQTSLSALKADADPRIKAAPTGLCRVPFDALRRVVRDAASHGDALLRLGRQILDEMPEFVDVPKRRKDIATVAKIEALRSADGQLGNHAQMEPVDLSGPAACAEGALFRPRAAPLLERARMGAARFVPTPLLRRIVQAEFSRPAIVLTVVPVARKLPPLFGLPLRAVHPAAPALGRPLLALTATRTGDGFDLCITAHGPDGAAVPGLSQTAATAMELRLQ